MAEVRISNVDKSFGDGPVIEGLDLVVDDEELLVLVGPSGCGKSTLLRLLAGLEEVDAGEIRIGGRVVNDVPPKDRDIAMVFQSYALYPHMTVRQNLEFGLKVRKVPKPERARLVGEAAEILDIAALLDRRPSQLSGGQQQRVAVGRAIVRKPAVFLFDEPLSNLDAALRVQMRAELTRLQRHVRTTTVYVTHDQVEAMTMGHRIAIMNRGRLQQVGPPLEVYDQPANLFVASFLGSPPMNLLHGRLADDGRSLEVGGALIPLPPECHPDTESRGGAAVVAGVRPEAVRRSGPAGAAPAAAITVTVELVEPLGDEVVVYGRLDDQPVAAKLGPHDLPEIGAPLELAVPHDAVHLFDPDTEQRLGP